MNLILIESKIKQLDYATHSPAAHIMDELLFLYNLANNNNDKHSIIIVLRILNDWISSINNVGLYSKLPSEHKDYFADQMRIIAMNKVLKGLLSIQSKIETSQKIRLVRKSELKGGK